MTNVVRPTYMFIHSASLGWGDEMSVLTEYDEQADQYGGQRAHAEFQFLALLDQLTVLSPKTVRTYASVPDPRVLVQAYAAVPAWAVQALVFVHASFPVRRHDASLAATANNRYYCRCHYYK